MVILVKQHRKAISPLLPTQKKKLYYIVFNATFKNFSVISWRSVSLLEETGELGGNLSQFTDKLYHIMLYRVTPSHQRDSNSQL